MTDNVFGGETAIASTSIDGTMSRSVADIRHTASGIADGASMMTALDEPRRTTMLYQMQSPGLTARMSTGHRRASMLCFERLCKRVLLTGSLCLAVAMTTFVCATTHLLG